MKHNKGAERKNYDLIKCNILLPSPFYAITENMTCDVGGAELAPFHVPILYVFFSLFYIFSFHIHRDDKRVDLTCSFQLEKNFANGISSSGESY